MNQNVKIILEIMKNMPSYKFEGVIIPKSLGYEQTGMCIDEFDEAIRYIEDNKFLENLITIYENNKIVMIKIS
jgi:hypothetical protein